MTNVVDNLEPLMFWSAFDQTDYPNGFLYNGVIFFNLTPPSDPRYIWGNISTSPAILYYYDTSVSDWVILNTVGATGTAAQVFSPLATNLTTDYIGATYTIDVVDRTWLQPGSYLLLWDGTYEMYVKCTDWSTMPGHTNGLYCTSIAGGLYSAPNGYTFETSNTVVLLSGAPGGGGSGGSGFATLIDHNASPIISAQNQLVTCVAT